MNEQQIIRRACVYYNYVWPKQLVSGVMFFEGTRITIEQFQAEAKKLSRRKAGEAE